MIYGQQYAHYPSDNHVIFNSIDFDVQLGGDTLTKDNEFNSNVGAGKLQYTTPSVDKLFGFPMKYFTNYNNLDFEISVMTMMPNSMTEMWELKQITPGWCRLRYSRNYTPLLYYLSPPVVFPGQLVGLYIDPKKAGDYKESQKRVFKDAKIDGYLLDFDGYVDEDTFLTPYAKNQVLGIVGDQPPNANGNAVMRFTVGNTLQMDFSHLHCSVDNTTCYKVKTVPTIDSISSSLGYTTGGQKLQIKGKGLDGNSVSVKVAGVDCTVISKSSKKITCETQSTATQTIPNTPQPGQQGLRRRVYNNTSKSSPPSFSTITQVTNVKEYLTTHMESPQNIGDYYANVFSGYFRAPLTARYRFYMACDDACRLYFSNTTGTPSDKANILSSVGYTGYRQYWAYNGSHISEWHSLTKDQYYYIELQHIEATASEHVSVAVEIEQSTVTDHHQSMQEIQNLQINPVNLREKTVITISNPDSGLISLKFFNPTTTTYTQTNSFSASATAAQLRTAISSYYSNGFSANIDVTLVMYDVNGVETTTAAQSVKNVYTVSVLRPLKVATTNYVTVTKTGSLSTVSIQYPASVQKSSAPLSGNFTISCPLSNGTTATTDPISFDVGHYTYQNNYGYTIRSKIGEACPEYQDAIDVWEGNSFNYFEEGRDIMIRFTGVKRDVPQFTIQSSSLSGNEITYKSQENSPASSNIFYDPIPFELLYTNETNPQVMVTVDGLPAVCAGLQCDYNYISTDALITSYTLSGKALSITGANLPTTLQSVSFSKVPCTSVSNDASSITCTLESDPVSGQWFPEVRDASSLIPLHSSVAATTIGVTISSLSANSASLNPSGNEQLEINGSNFPPTLSTAYTVSVAFSSGNTCNVVSTTTSKIICTTTKFSSSNLSSVTLTVTINGQTDNSHTVDVSSSPASITDISPKYVSPVLKSNITLTIGPSFTNTLVKDDYTVTFTLSTNSSQYKKARVVAVDNVKRTLQVFFGGAPSDTYTVTVYNSQYGQFESSSITLQTIGQVTSYYPNFGSIYGGTILTINGYNFSSDPLDNPVKIGKTDCNVISATNEQIKCRVALREDPTEVDESLIVFLKTSEEAVCASGLCKYSWSTIGLPTVTDMQTPFDSALNEYVLTITGTDFTGSASTTELYIDGIKQTITSQTSTTITATITGMKNVSTTDVELYFAEGTPSGYEVLQNGFSLTPKLVSITPSIGSPAGSIITANIQGVGVNTQGLALVSSTGAYICSSITVVAFGKVQCKTNATIASVTDISVKYNSALNACANADTTQCQFSTSTTMPAVTTNAISVDQLTITLTGTNFFTSGYTAHVTYGGVEADSVQVTSDTSAVATYNLGVPYQGTAMKPSLYFVSISSPETHWAQSTATGLTNIFQSTTSSSSLQCSFAGGCTYNVQALGVAATLTNSAKAQINVCGKTCKVVSSSQSSSGIDCVLPSLDTVHSVQEYNTTSAASIMGATWANNWRTLPNLFDGNNNNGYLDFASSNVCFIGTSFKENYVGLLSEVKFFMQRFTKTQYSGKLEFQGSNDNSTFTTIFSVGEEIHEGWNYYDFADGQEPKYRHFRFYGTTKGACNIGELVIKGVEVIDDTQNTYTCTPQLVIDGASTNLNPVTYTSTKTPLLTSISPRFGTVKGGEDITFTGTNFDNDYTKYTILIDKVACIPKEATTTYIKCTTGKRPGIVPDTTLEISISGYGKVSTQGKQFRYVNYWSDEDTWGGDFQPDEGDSVYVPKGLHLLMNVDSTPVLQAVIVEGSLIFPSDDDANHVRTFDAHYVFLKGGYMEVGTESEPYSSKLIITMHGTKESPEIPIYGNKVIAVREGHLELHGIPRNPTWTELYTTASPGSNSITLNTEVDWKVGDVIVIAPTGYYNDETEQRTITAVDRTTASKPVITLDTALEFKHYAGVETYGTDTLEMRAEVGLLTRNVIYRGDPETSYKNQYGAHIMLHSQGDESLIGRISYCEFTDVGQAFQLGRYPLHFHLIGTVHNSYIKGNALHRTYNRAVTIHAVHYLRITENVAYDTKGHTFFIEDAIETKNYLERNLAMLTQQSNSLLNTDQTPASFWITNPDNIFRGNHAAGSDRYGFWFDLQVNPTGPSFDPNICPINMPLGEFKDNVAHSNVRYGLRLFHGHVPRTYPCKPLNVDLTNTTDPHHNNPLITATYENYVGWKNGRNGAIAERVGDVRFVNFKVADNILAGIEFSLTDQTVERTAQIYNALIVGHSANADDDTLSCDAHGIITPRTEGFIVRNVKFYNFDINNMAALGSCSHCFHPASTDSGARTVKFEGLYFDSSVTQRIFYQTPFRAIYQDLDGTLTGLGANSWATPYWQHNVQPECQVDLDHFNGIICNNTVQVRRIVYYNYNPQHFDGMDMRITKWDDNLLTGLTNTSLKAYQEDFDNFSQVPWRQKQDPIKAWAMPFVTGHKYKVHWRFGLDFVKMQVDLSTRWEATDKNLYIVHNFTDVRQQVDFLTGSDNIKNNTLNTKSISDWQTGDNVVYNETEVREIHYVINGKNSTRKTINLVGYRCVGNCLTTVNTTEIENTTRLWSQNTSWPSGKVPEAGENVEVEAGWNMVFDMAESPIYQLVQVNGRLTFLNNTNLNFRVKHLFVRAGELIIGNETHPFNGSAKITLHGEKSAKTMVYDNAIEAGNKVIANTGTIKMFGQKRQNIVTRLHKTVYPGEQEILVESNLDWVAGDQIALAPTAIRANDSDYAIIASYNNQTGVITLDRKITGYHWGAPTSTGPNYDGVDMRGEVLLLSRNIIVRGEDIESWGGQMVTSDFVEEDGTFRNGVTLLDNVEFYNCSQMDTYHAALRFDSAANAYSSVTNSAFHHGLGWGLQITLAANIRLVNNVFFDFSTIGGNIETSKNITLDKNYFVRMPYRMLFFTGKFFDPRAGLSVCGYNYPDVCSQLTITNNVVAGTHYAGFAGMLAHECGQSSSQNVFRNNIAHSVEGNGAVIYPNVEQVNQITCFEASYFTAYKCSGVGAVTFSRGTQGIFSNMIMIDNGWGVSVNVVKDQDGLNTQMNKIKFYGETEARDCVYENQCIVEAEAESPPLCIFKSAFMNSHFQVDAQKEPFPRSLSQHPQYRVKEDAAWAGTSQSTSLEFINYATNKTWCGSGQGVFQNNPFSSDLIAVHEFYKTKFTNVTQAGFGYFMDPPIEWAHLDDCGAFPCTAPMNYLLQFEQTSYNGPSPKNSDSDFQIISNNKNVAVAMGCSFQKEFNAYYCLNPNTAQLLFESLDEDTKDRTVTPIVISSSALPTYSNVLNSFMDHGWDGFYTSQKRLSRFPAVIQAGQKYTVSYSGTPPNKQRFTLLNAQKGVTIQIKYPKAGTYELVDNRGKVYQGNNWDEATKQVAPITGTKCGENRFVGVENILEFYLTYGCTLTIRPKDALQTRIRLEWTMAEFFADGGTTKFVDRLAASLNIHASSIKIVAVYQGSVNVVFSVTSPVNATTGQSISVDEVQTVLQQAIKTNQIWLGANILDSNVGTTTIVVTDNTNHNYNPNPVDNTNTAGNTNQQGNNQGTTNQQTTTTTTPTYNKGNTNSTTSTSSTTPVGLQDDSKKKLLIIIGVIIGACALLTLGGWLIYRKLKAASHLVKSKPEHPSIGSPGEEEEEYEPQYHPKAELFNTDKMKKKVNDADIVKDETILENDERQQTITEHSQSMDNRDSILKESTPLNSQRQEHQRQSSIVIKQNSQRRKSQYMQK